MATHLTQSNGYKPDLSSTQESDHEEVLASGQSNNEEDSSIDDCLAALEDIVFSQEFSELQDNFFGKYCSIFEDTEENLLVYTEIFNEYGRVLDEYLSKRLKDKLPNFNLSEFAAWLLTHEDEIAGDIVELIHSTTDFLHFKASMLEHKSKHLQSNGSNGHQCSGTGSDNIDLTRSFSVSSCKIYFQ